MADDSLHGDAHLAGVLMARLTPEQRAGVLASVPEFQALQHARRMLWLRVGHCGNEGSTADLLDLYCSEDP